MMQNARILVCRYGDTDDLRDNAQKAATRLRDEGYDVIYAPPVEDFDKINRMALQEDADLVICIAADEIPDNHHPADVEVLITDDITGRIKEIKSISQTRQRTKQDLQNDG